MVVLTCGNRATIGPYRAALEMAGLEAQIVTADAPFSLDGCRGLVLSGGRDVDPARYGADPDSRTQAPDRARDDMEIALLRQALDRDIPVLGICRGVQLLNVALGGTLHQHIEGHTGPEDDHAAEVHDVIVRAGSRLAAVSGAGRMPVNSRHHQAVAVPAAGLRVVAQSPTDGVIEGLEHPDKRFVVAVQWHPEDRVGLDFRQRRVFEAFARIVGATAA